jgi:hypothetical protein
MQMRTRALARRRVPDELDRLLTVAPLATWLVVAALTLVVAALLVWGFAGSLPRRVSAQGLLSGPQGPAVVQSSASGRVDAVLTSAGAQVKAGDPVLRVTTDRGERTLRASAAGLVADIDVAAGQVVGRGTSLYELQPATQPGTLDALLFLSPKQGAAITPGMKTNLSVASAPSTAFGVLRGEVRSVSSYPASGSALTAMLGNPDLARYYSRDGPPLVARIRLVADRDTRSGLEWSTHKGPPFPLRPGTTVSAQITQQDQTPIDAVFGK